MIHLYPLNELISNLMPATGLKKLARGEQRAEKARHFEKIQLGEHLATNYINWPQVYHMISYKARYTPSRWPAVAQRQDAASNGQASLFGVFHS